MRLFQVILAVLALMLLPNLVFAHTQLIGTIPLADTVEKGQTKEIKLAFDTKIEQGSTFTIEDESGKNIPVQQIQVDGKQMTGNTSTVLPNGKVTVHWSAIGADGHTSEGSYQFQVQKKWAQPADSSQQPKKTGWLPYLPLFLGAFGLIILVLVFSFIKRRTDG